VGSGKEYEEWSDRPGASSATGLLPYAHKQQEVGLESLLQYLLWLLAPQPRLETHPLTLFFLFHAYVAVCCHVCRRRSWGPWSKRWPPSPGPARTRTPSPRPPTLLRPRVRVDGYVYVLFLAWLVVHDVWCALRATLVAVVHDS
jgi:hypothetical protein